MPKMSQIQGMNMIEILGVMYLTEKEAANKYGFSLSWFKLKRYDSKRECRHDIPFVRVRTGRILYPVKELDEWFRVNIIKG
jgi:hypothetical protein